MANSVGPDQMLHSVASDLGLCTVCSGLSVRMFRVIQVLTVTKLNCLLTDLCLYCLHVCAYVKIDILNSKYAG